MMYYSRLIVLLAVGACAQSSTIAPAASITRMISASGSGLTNPTEVTIYGLDNTANTYDASVVDADQAATTFNMQCISGLILCPNNRFMLTSASNSIRVENTQSASDVTAVELFTCNLSGTTSASCKYSLSVRTSGTDQTTATSTVYASTTKLPFAIVTVTAGQVKLANASNVAPQTTTPNAAYRASIMSTTTEKGMLMTMLMGASVALVFAIVL